MEKNMFVLVEASKLRWDDEFMKHKPKNYFQRKFKKRLSDVIYKGIPDFWCQRIDPSVDEEGNICFKVGLKPAVDKSYNWWSENAKKFDPQSNSRLGTKEQYIAFLGVLMKALLSEGWTVDEVWEAVCYRSEKLGHYWNSPNSIYGLETTGSRECAGFCDLANTFKLLAESKEYAGFWFAGSSWGFNSYDHPLADNFGHYIRVDDKWDDGVGWIVMD